MVLNDMIIFDEESELVEQIFADIQDTVSREFGNQDGVTFCGARNYELVDAESHAAYLKLEGKKI